MGLTHKRRPFLRRYRTSDARSVLPHARRLGFEPLEDRRLLSGTAQPQGLGASAMVEGPAAGSDSCIVSLAGPWTATANAPWLHTSSSGNASGLAAFTFDANTGPTRMGTLTIAGQTLTVTQAGIGYLAAGRVSLPNLSAIAADASGNVYFVDSSNGEIQEWHAATKTISTAVSSGLLNPQGLAVDGAGNVYVADGGDKTIKQWNATTATLTTLVSSGLCNPVGVAVDDQGNVYIADAGDKAVKEWNATTKTLTTLVTSELDDPEGVAVDGAGNVYIADMGYGWIREWNAASKTVSTLLATGSGGPYGLAVDHSGNLYYITYCDDTGGQVPRMSGYEVVEWDSATRTTSILVSPWSDYLHGLTVDGAGNVYIVDTRNNSIWKYDPATRSTDMPIVPWLWNPSGVAVDSSGKVYIADSDNKAIKEWNAATQTLDTLVSSGLSRPSGMAVDGSGNVYIADTGDNTIKEWNAATRTVSTLVSSVTRAEYVRLGIAVDALGNIYIADCQENAIKEWNASTQTVSTLVSSGLSQPQGVAVDSLGNVYIADTGHDMIKEWNTATQTLSTLVSSGLSRPQGLAVGGTGDIYFFDSDNAQINEWNAATQEITPLWGLSYGNWYNVPGMAVDAAGNLYVVDSAANRVEELPLGFVPGSPIRERAAAGNDALTVVLPAGESLTGILAPRSNASWLTLGSVSGGVINFSFTPNMGAARTAYITVLGQQVAVTQAAILATTALVESAAAGSGSVVVSYAGPWTATANAPWLHTSSTGNGDGLATFTFDANTGPTRTGTLTIAGHTLTVTQTTALGATSLLEGPDAGSDSDAVNYAGSWTATANAPWLHSSANGSGYGVATFTFDANPGPTRTGTLTIAGEVLTVTQAGTGYVASNTCIPLISPPLVHPRDVAVDHLGNVYIADTGNNAIKVWNAATQALSTLVSSGLDGPMAVALDAAGNVYIVDSGSNAIKQWNAATQTVSTLVSAGLNSPQGLALDAAGNVYIADTGNNVIKEWNAATNTVSVLVSSGLHFPADVAVDAAGNIYIAQVNDREVRQWNAATQTLGTLVTLSSLNSQFRLAVDVGGNLYICDMYDNEILQWNAATHTVSTLVSSGLSGPEGLAVDGAGNVYIADTFDNALKVWSPSTETLDTLVASAAGVPESLAVDCMGNLYFLSRDASGTAVHEWNAATQTISSLVFFEHDFVSRCFAVDGVGNVYVAEYIEGAGGCMIGVWNHETKTLNTLAGSRIGCPTSVAVDNAGNVYVAEYSGWSGNSTIAEWNATTQTLSPLVSWELNYLWELDFVTGMAVDASGNLYFTDSGNIKEWNAATQTLITLVSSGLQEPTDVAVDSAGNLCIVDSGDKTIKKWNAVTQTLTTLVSLGPQYPEHIAVDAEGNIYVLDTGNDSIEELPRAFVPGGPISETAAAGSDVLATVVAANESLVGVFAPSSDQNWLTVDDVSGGVVHFSFTENTGPARTAHITVLGQQVAVTQAIVTVAEVSPASGSSLGGTTVTITGTGFADATAVNFGATPAVNFHVDSPTQITATSPPGTGVVDVTVTTPMGTTPLNRPADQFGYAPLVTAISSARGPAAGGTTVTITGTGFAGATAVNFGTTPVTNFHVDSPTQITATSPPGTGVVDVTVTTPLGTTPLIRPADQFSYAPAVTAISPARGPATGGTSVTITGAGFTGATAVNFGTTPATNFHVDSPTQITATSPAGMGVVDVTVTTPVGTTPLDRPADQFGYAPVLTAISSARGTAAGGASVTITGAGFTGATAVNFGTAPAVNFHVDSANQITATSPPGTGVVDVTVTTPVGTTPLNRPADQFSYAPVVTAIRPAWGPAAGGTTITITGAGFTGATAVNFGKTRATRFHVDSPTQITATSPAGTGVVDVTVTTPLGTTPASRPADGFSYAPVVSKISPALGAVTGGTSVTITGANLLNATAVTFGTRAVTNFVSHTATTIVVKSPPGTGTVHVTVRSAGGVSATSLTDRFTYVAAPVVSKITPARGPVAGGTSVTITGGNLLNATAVNFGTRSVTNFVSRTATAIVVKSPPGSGTVYVTVRSAGGVSAISVTDKFTYVPAPIVSKISPVRGPAAGGTSVTITGANLLDVTAVKFGTRAVTSFVSRTATNIVVKSPPGTGTVFVTVTSAGGVSATSVTDKFTYLASAAVGVSRGIIPPSLNDLALLDLMTPSNPSDRLHRSAIA